jgi:hypothetical protein
MVERHRVPLTRLGVPSDRTSPRALLVRCHERSGLTFHKSPDHLTFLEQRCVFSPHRISANLTTKMYIGWS